MKAINLHCRAVSFIAVHCYAISGLTNEINHICKQSKCNNKEAYSNAMGVNTID